MIIRIARQFGQCIRARREELGWSQDELARRAGVSRSTVYRLEVGTTTSLYPANLLSVLDALGLEVTVGPESGDDAVPQDVGTSVESDMDGSVSEIEEIPIGDLEDQSSFGLADLLAMGDAYKVYAAELKRRDADASPSDGQA